MSYLVCPGSVEYVPPSSCSASTGVPCLGCDCPGKQHKWFACTFCLEKTFLSFSLFMGHDRQFFIILQIKLYTTRIISTSNKNWIVEYVDYLQYVTEGAQPKQHYCKTSVRVLGKLGKNMFH